MFRDKFIYSIENIDKETNRLRDLLDKCNDSEDMGYYEKAIVGLQKVKYLVEKDCAVVDYAPGLVLINDRFVMAYRGHKWRIEGKAPWYNYKDIESFYVNNVERSAVSMTPNRMMRVIEGFKLTCEFNNSTLQWSVRNYKFEGQGPELKEAVVNFLHNLDEDKKNKIAQEIREQQRV